MNLQRATQEIISTIETSSVNQMIQVRSNHHEGTQVSAFVNKVYLVRVFVPELFHPLIPEQTKF